MEKIAQFQRVDPSQYVLHVLIRPITVYRSDKHAKGPYVGITSPSRVFGLDLRVSLPERA
jgi:hypothetical protein